MAAEPSSTLLPFNTLIHMSQKLIGHVDETLEPPPRFALANSQTPNIKHLAWKQTDQRLLSLLLSSLTEEAMAEVVGLTTSREVWIALENTFSHRSKAREIRLKDDLQLMKRSTRSVSEYAHLVPKAESFELFQKSLELAVPLLLTPLTNRGTLPFTILKVTLVATVEGRDASLVNAPRIVRSAVWKAIMRIDAGNASDCYLDTGASAHMTSDHCNLDQSTSYTGKDCVIVGNGASLPITHTEFTSNRFQAQLHTSGIHHQLSCPHTPAQNGRAERKHRHVTETGLALLFHSHIPTYFWVDAFSTAAYIINRLPTSLLRGSSLSHSNSSTAPPEPVTELPIIARPPISATSSGSHPMLTRAKADIFKTRHPAHLGLVESSGLLSALLASTEPKGFKSAAKNPAWLNAMDDEIQALQILSSKLPLFRVVLSLAVTNKWPLRQFDVKNAFLNGHLTEHVYMEQPPGYIDPRFPNHVCQLKKALYGLKQAPRAWFQRFSSFLLQLGFYCSRADTSLFVFHKHSDIIYLLLYVDDIIITGNNPSLLENFTCKLNSEFATKDLGSLSYFLGLEATPTTDGLFISQLKYAHDILTRAQLLDSKPVHTPMVVSQHLSADGPLFSDPTLYRSLVGALQYLTITRPDITHAVNSVSQFLHSPTDNHYLACQNAFFAMLRAHCILVFTFHPSIAPGALVAYSDADWAGCPDTRRSTSGYSIYLGDNLVSLECQETTYCLSLQL
uniref:Integrase catalytic domain-containing protein n=1 Tax=Fagus sylvatica TaxID=28930 RepID=A0A2N9HB18_FAGSY